MSSNKTFQNLSKIIKLKESEHINELLREDLLNWEIIKDPFPVSGILTEFIKKQSRIYGVDITKSKIGLEDQMLYEVEQISENVKKNTGKVDSLIEELQAMNNKFDELIESIIMLGSEIKSSFVTSKKPFILKGKIISAFPEELVPQFDDPHKKIEHLRKKIKEIGPISKRSANDYDE